MSKKMLLVGTWVVLFVGGCCMGGGSAPTPFGAPAPVAAPTAPGAAPVAAAGDVCARAEECCRAYVAAMGPAAAAAASSCDAMHTSIGIGMAAPGCQSAIEGWRTGLSAMQQPVPPSCQ